MSTESIKKRLLEAGLTEEDLTLEGALKQALQSGDQDWIKEAEEHLKLHQELERKRAEFHRRQGE